MTREDARKAAEVMLAYADGKEVEVRKGDKWFPSDTVAFNWCDFRYRVKPQPKYRPFKSAEECWQEMQKHQPFGWICDSFSYFAIIRVIADHVTIKDSPKLSNVFFDDAFGWFFPDGAPFGIKEEE